MPVLVLNKWQGMLGNTIIQVYNVILIAIHKKYNIRLPNPDPEQKNKFSKYSTFYKKRDIICEKLYKLGIETRPVISGDFSKQNIIKQRFKSLAKSQFTNADKIHTSGFMLGISSKKIDVKIIIRLANDIKKVIKEII